MKTLGNQDGFIKGAFCMAVLVAAVYAGFQFGTPYYRYSMFKYDVKEIAIQELGNVEKIKERILESAWENTIPIEEKDIVITKTERKVRIKTAWSVDVDFWELYSHPLRFAVDIEE